MHHIRLRLGILPTVRWGPQGPISKERKRTGRGPQFEKIWPPPHPSSDSWLRAWTQSQLTSIRGSVTSVVSIIIIWFMLVREGRQLEVTDMKTQCWTPSVSTQQAFSNSSLRKSTHRPGSLINTDNYYYVRCQRHIQPIAAVQPVSKRYDARRRRLTEVRSQATISGLSAARQIYVLLVTSQRRYGRTEVRRRRMRAGIHSHGQTGLATDDDPGTILPLTDWLNHCYNIRYDTIEEINVD